MFIKHIKEMEEMREDIEQRVLSLIEDASWFEKEIHLDDNIFIEIGFDDLDYMELIIELEKEFGIQLPDEEIYDVVTPRDIINLILEKI